MNRQMRKAVDRQADKSIEAIKSHLNFLNAAGNPKYRLVRQSTFGWKVRRIVDKVMFWS